VSTAPAVSVIIPHYNDLESLELCLNLLKAQTFDTKDFEIIVADNNSRCGFLAVSALCERIGTNIKAVPAPIQGAGPARNAAVAASAGPILALIDCDCRPAVDWIEKGLEALKRCDVLGGRVDTVAFDPRNPTAVEAFEMVFAFNFKRYIEQEGFTGAGNMFTRRTIFDAVGPFRNGVAEDFDWSKRAVTAGYSLLYDDHTVVRHPARRTYDELKKKWRRVTREAFNSMIETPNGHAKWILRSFLVLISPFGHIPKVARSHVLTPKQKLQALRVLFAIRFWRFYRCQYELLARPS
jgi:cellulose synthase/poly-beta-1,6-N-acetylglucosamine synthase-like glycosyltransferase